MDGTFALPDYFGPNAYVSHIYLTNSTDDLPDIDFLKFGNSSTSTETGLGKRYTEKVKSHTYTAPPQFADRIISYETQVKISAFANTCDQFVASYSTGSEKHAIAADIVDSFLEYNSISHYGNTDGADY
ncbi:hypothetical protein N7490_007288 [Penicillium lividum]|nr:hypothetical protein N7490_007288 [Penicillium lividum]